MFIAYRLAREICPKCVVVKLDRLQMLCGLNLKWWSGDCE